MAKYEITYSCGHVGTVTLYGRSRERDRKIEWLQGKICPQCERAQEQEENAKFEEEYDGLVSLSGSEKQVAYGRTCRRRAIIAYENMIECGFAKNDEEWREYFCKNDSASWWIDIIECESSLEIERMNTRKSEIIRPDSPQLDDHDVLVPEEQRTSDIARITGSKEEIYIKSPKNSTIIDTVKKMGYKWDGRTWYFRMGVTTGKPADRVAEIGNKLLLQGVPVAIKDDEARQKAQDGTFEPLKYRWLTVTADGKIRIKWEKGDDSMYYAALRLPHAKYYHGGVNVDAKNFDEIRDFASINEYSISEGAEKALEAAEDAYNKAKRITPIEVDKIVSKDGLQAILESDRGILDDLKDD